MNQPISAASARSQKSSIAHQRPFRTEWVATAGMSGREASSASVSMAVRMPPVQRDSAAPLKTFAVPMRTALAG